jgi:hypothetical protein
MGCTPQATRRRASSSFGRQRCPYTPPHIVYVITVRLLWSFTRIHAVPRLACGGAPSWRFLVKRGDSAWPCLQAKALCRYCYSEHPMRRQCTCADVRAGVGDSVPQKWPGWPQHQHKKHSGCVSIPRCCFDLRCNVARCLYALCNLGSARLQHRCTSVLQFAVQM